MGALIGELVVKPAIKATVMFFVMDGLKRLMKSKKKEMPMVRVQNG